MKKYIKPEMKVYEMGLTQILSGSNENVIETEVGEGYGTSQ